MFLLINRLTDLPVSTKDNPGCYFNTFIQSLLESVRENKDFLEKFAESSKFFSDYSQVENFFRMYEDRNNCLK